MVDVTTPGAESDLLSPINFAKIKQNQLSSKLQLTQAMTVKVFVKEKNRRKGDIGFFNLKQERSNSFANATGSADAFPKTRTQSIGLGALDVEEKYLRM